jgi:hypothetical protein
LIIRPAAKFELLSAFFALKNVSAEEIRRELCAAIYSKNVMSEELEGNGVQCSKMSEQMFTMKSEVVGHL